MGRSVAVLVAALVFFGGCAQKKTALEDPTINAKGQTEQKNKELDYSFWNNLAGDLSFLLDAAKAAKGGL